MQLNFIKWRVSFVTEKVYNSFIKWKVSFVGGKVSNMGRNGAIGYHYTIFLCFKTLDFVNKKRLQLMAISFTKKLQFFFFFLRMFLGNFGTHIG